MLICKGCQYISVETQSALIVWRNNSAGVSIGGDAIVCEDCDQGV